MLNLEKRILLCVKACLNNASVTDVCANYEEQFCVKVKLVVIRNILHVAGQSKFVVMTPSVEDQVERFRVTTEGLRQLEK